MDTDDKHDAEKEDTKNGLIEDNEEKYGRMLEDGTSGRDGFQDGGDDLIAESCGLLSCRPALLQPLARVGCFTFTYGISALVTSTLSVYVNSQVTTLERQFGFSSNQTGLIMAANDVGFLVCVLFVAYVASKLHIPKALGTMTIIFGISGIVCCLPHFFFGSVLNLQPPPVSNTTSLVIQQKRKTLLIGDLCTTGNGTSLDVTCLQEKGSKDENTSESQTEAANISLVIIFIGMMLQGFGKAPRASYTTTYVDNNSKKTNTGFYMGVIIAMAIFGPAIAFLLGGVFSRIYVTLEATDLTPKHPKWIGAWWLGYIVFGTLGLLVSVPLFCFPRRLPRRGRSEERDNPKEHQEKNGTHQLMSVASSGTKSEPQPKPNQSGGKVSKVVWVIKDFLSMLYRLLTNPVYISIVLATCFKLFVIGGSSAFTPKYLETMFDLPAYKANYIIAGNVLCASCLGTFIGGYLSKRLKMTANKALKFSLVSILVSMTANMSGLIFACDQPQVYGGPGSPLECGDNCACDDESYFPVCGDDSKTYYSPCMAGCVGFEDGTYSNCTCIPGGGATPGPCDYSCDYLYAYVISKAVMSLFGTLWIIPKIIIVIRCVSEHDKPLALGFSSFLTSLLGWMLGPIVFGNFIDKVCDVWDVNKCGGRRGRCLRYDNDDFRLKFHGYTSVALVGATACIIFANVYARYTGCLLTEEEKKERDEKQAAKEYKKTGKDNGSTSNVKILN